MKKIRLLLILAAAGIMLAACGTQEKENKEAEKKPTEETTTEAAEEVPEIDEIDQDAADSYLEEKLEGLECHAIFSEYTEVDGVDVYLYSVVNKEEEELDQMLAVNAVSGEVMVYDYDNDKLLNFDRFQYYDDKGDGPVSWDSKYYLEPRTVEFMPADDNSFEFSIIKDDDSEPELEGVARIDEGDNHEAVYEDSDVSLTFVNKGDTLEIRDNGNISGMAGIYSREE
ncbi:MAG: hypothetical protein K5668_00155 [Lachnospiraceae bacterium]|nr:hypothetical protein [Lachnospiraceae bacterium]